MAATLDPPRLLPSGDAAIAVEFSRNVDDAANQRVLALDRALAEAPVSGVTETVPTYRSLLVHYDPTEISFNALGEKLASLAQRPLRPQRNPGAGEFRSAMVASMASIWRMSRKRSTHHLKRLWRGTSPAIIALP